VVDRDGDWRGKELKRRGNERIKPVDQVRAT
jgi:hypothetical protein